MIFQIYFTFAAELVALALGTALVCWTGKKFAKIMGVLIIAGALVLMLVTANSYYNALNKTQTTQDKNPSRVHMQFAPTGPVKGGYLKDIDKK